MKEVTNLMQHKTIMEEELTSLLHTLFQLPEVEKVAIKDIIISSVNDMDNITKGLEQCYHDKYSDLDITVWFKLNPIDFHGEPLIYKKFFWRLQLKNRIFGVSFQRQTGAPNKELIRICLNNSIRLDVLCFIRSDEKMPLLSKEEIINKNLPEPMDISLADYDLEKADEFWFNAILALGKLRRKDYLISSHLAHMLLMEGLVIQMILRDKEYNTFFHRDGYSELLEYMDINNEDICEFIVPDDFTYNHITELLYKAVTSYDNLVQTINKNYNSRCQVFFEIWRSYMEI